MSIIRKMRKQKAVWWARNESPNTFGQYGFAEPVEVDCRWDDTIQAFLDAQGETQQSRAAVYVDRVMRVGDRLRQGDIESDEPSDPLTLDDAFEIRRFDQNPNLKATETLLTAFL